MKLFLAALLALFAAMSSGELALAETSSVKLAGPAFASETSSGGLEEDIALTKAAVLLLQAGNFAAMREQMDPAAGQIADDKFRLLSDMLGTSEPASIETLWASERRNLQTGDSASRIYLEYGFGGRWVFVDAVVKTTGAKKQFLRLYMSPNTKPLRQLNAFHLLGKGAPQYLFLAVWLVVIAFTACAAYLAFIRNRGWRRWVLPLLMPLGLTPAVAMNWNVAQFSVLEATSNSAGTIIPIFAARWPMAFYEVNAIGATSLYISAPLLAVVYLIVLLVRRKTAGAPAA